LDAIHASTRNIFFGRKHPSKKWMSSSPALQSEAAAASECDGGQQERNHKSEKQQSLF